MDLKKRNFLKVIQKHRGTIRSLCKVYYAHSEDQQDAYQDIILQLWKSYGTFRGKSDIGTWIYRVSLNTLLSSLRKAKRTVAMEPLDASHVYLSHGIADDNVELVAQMLQSLKDLDKAITILHLEGYQHKEIADILKISATNVSTRFNRIKAQLKVKFNRNPYETR